MACSPNKSAMSSDRALREEIKRKRNGPTPGGVSILSSGQRENLIDRINACVFVSGDLKDRMLKEYFSFKSSIDALTSKLNKLEVLLQKFDAIEQQRELKKAKSEYEQSTDDEHNA
jgi:hypothetical protein